MSSRTSHTKSRITTAEEKSPALAPLFLYFCVLAALLAASFLPEYRLWGLSVWAYFPVWVRLVLFGVGSLIPVGVCMVQNRSTVPEPTLQMSGRRLPGLLAGLIVLAVAGMLFYLLHNRTHFLGDGYTLLSSLAKDNPLVKTREIGEAMAHVWLKDLFGSGTRAALASFRVISIGGGLLFLATLLITASRLFETVRERTLFAIGVASGGYLLLFFGYVENYSLFVWSILTYTMIGLLIAQGRITRWAVLPALALSILLHTFGAVLIPSALYLLGAGTPVGSRIARAGEKSKLLLAVVVVVIGGYAFNYSLANDPFLRFAFVPLVESRFTIEGYTLFSADHLADYVNLLLILLPGLPVLIWVAVRRVGIRVLKQRGVFFLLVLVLSGLGAAFIFDPKLGMPRDWDLFSFIGVPLAALGYLLVLRSRMSHRRQLLIGVLCIALGLLSLGSRVAEQMIPAAAEARVWDYASLDRVKNRNTRIVLEEYYKEIGRFEEMEPQLTAWQESFPEEQMLNEALQLMNSAEYRRAKEIILDVIDINANYWNAWSTLGASYHLLGQRDSAKIALIIASGLNPYNAPILNNLANVYFVDGDYSRARKCWEKALKLDSLLLGTLTGLDRLDQQLGAQTSPCRHLARAARNEKATAAIAKTLGDCLAGRGESRRARQAYLLALRRGADTTEIRELISQLPE